MSREKQFFIDGGRVDPLGSEVLEVIDPATEEAFAEIAMGNEADVDRAVAAAKAPVPSFALATKQDRLALLPRALDLYAKPLPEGAPTLSPEMGAPIPFPPQGQAAMR